MLSNDPRANPLAGNPLASRSDHQRAVVDLVEPLIPHMSAGSARVRLGSGAALFAQRVAELEGYARPLYGIVPLVAGGGEFAHWDRWCQGLDSGTNPDHDEYWGAVEMNTDQRMVEMAAIGFAMAFVPEHFWDPLSDSAKERVLAWLDGIDAKDPAPNNWQFFRLLVHLGRSKIGSPGDAGAAQRSLEMIESYYRSDGWYVDGVLGRTDYYLPFAFHTYGLIYAASGQGDPEISALYLERAMAFAPQFENWFAPDGAAFGFGRSMTYRFAQASMWGALALADLEALPWGRLRGLASRHMRWWSEKPISDRDGVLSIGYGYDNRRLQEGYNSPGSPYWAMKGFAGLAAPEDHPFWRVAEEPQPPWSEPVGQPQAGLVLDRDETHVVALAGRQTPSISFVEQTTAKYDKFAYSSRFGFSGDLEFHYGEVITDSTLVLHDGESRRVRSRIEEAFVADSMVWSRWRPWDDVLVDTVLIGGTPWHHRVHLIRTGRDLRIRESGFALGVESMWLTGSADVTQSDGGARLQTQHGLAGIVDREGERPGQVRPLPPNANTMEPQTAAPTLGGRLDAGTHRLVTSVLAGGPETALSLDDAPPVPEAAFELLASEASRETRPVELIDISELIRKRN